MEKKLSTYKTASSLFYSALFLGRADCGKLIISIFFPFIILIKIKPVGLFKVYLKSSTSVL